MLHSYTINLKHRNGTPAGSQWIITQKEERDCFETSANRSWLLERTGWGLYFDETNVLSYLGRAVDRDRLLVVAKFVASETPVVWHGYPADHERNNHDIPDQSILKSWVRERVLPRPTMRKIMSGQPCRL
jgi:hypothetical protein